MSHTWGIRLGQINLLLTYKLQHYQTIIVVLECYACSRRIKAVNTLTQLWILETQSTAGLARHTYQNSNSTNVNWLTNHFWPIFKAHWTWHLLVAMLTGPTYCYVSHKPEQRTDYFSTEWNNLKLSPPNLSVYPLIGAPLDSQENMYMAINAGTKIRSRKWK